MWKTRRRSKTRIFFIFFGKRAPQSSTKGEKLIFGRRKSLHEIVGAFFGQGWQGKWQLWNPWRINQEILIVWICFDENHTAEKKSWEFETRRGKASLSLYSNYNFFGGFWMALIPNLFWISWRKKLKPRIANFLGFEKCMPQDEIFGGIVSLSSPSWAIKSMDLFSLWAGQDNRISWTPNQDIHRFSLLFNGHIWCPYMEQYSSTIPTWAISLKKRKEPSPRHIWKKDRNSVLNISNSLGKKFSVSRYPEYTMYTMFVHVLHSMCACVRCM